MSTKRMRRLAKTVRRENRRMKKTVQVLQGAIRSSILSVPISFSRSRFQFIIPLDPGTVESSDTLDPIRTLSRRRR